MLLKSNLSSMKTHESMKTQKKVIVQQRQFVSYVHYDFNLENSIHSMPNEYSCAIDSFFEIIFHVVYPKLCDQNVVSEFLLLCW